MKHVMTAIILPGNSVVKFVGLKHVWGFIMLRSSKYMPKSDDCECSQLAVNFPIALILQVQKLQ